MAAVARRLTVGLDPDELDRMARSLADAAAELRAQADLEVRLPELASVEERQRWWDSRPSVDVEVDPGLTRTVSTSIRLPVSTIEGYTALAKELGFRSGQTLMKAVLNSYLARHGGRQTRKRAKKGAGIP